MNNTPNINSTAHCKPTDRSKTSHTNPKTMNHVVGSDIEIQLAECLSPSNILDNKKLQNLLSRLVCLNTNEIRSTLNILVKQIQSKNEETAVCALNILDELMLLGNIRVINQLSDPKFIENLIKSTFVESENGCSQNVRECLHILLSDWSYRFKGMNLIVQYEKYFETINPKSKAHKIKDCYADTHLSVRKLHEVWDNEVVMKCLLPVLTSSTVPSPDIVQLANSVIRSISSKMTELDQFKGTLLKEIDAFDQSGIMLSKLLDECESQIKQNANNTDKVCTNVYDAFELNKKRKQVVRLWNICEQYREDLLIFIQRHESNRMDIPDMYPLWAIDKHRNMTTVERAKYVMNKLTRIILRTRAYWSMLWPNVKLEELLKKYDIIENTEMKVTCEVNCIQKSVHNNSTSVKSQSRIITSPLEEFKKLSTQVCCTFLNIGPIKKQLIVSDHNKASLKERSKTDEKPAVL